MKRITRIIILLICLYIFTGNTQARDIKWAQSGFQFLSVPTDARAVSMAEANTAVEMKSGSIFFNPACMSRMTDFIDITLSQNKWIAGIDHNTLSLALAPFGGRFGVLGFSARSVNYGDVQGAAVSSNDQGYILTDIITPTASSFGLSYAKSITDRFSVGGQVKYVTQDFGNMVIAASSVSDSTTMVNYSLSPIAYDFGTIFNTNIKSLKFGMSVRNFSEEIKYENEGFQLPLVFNFGISVDLMDFTTFSNNHGLLLAVDAAHYRARQERIKMGIEYTFLNLLSMRAGYVSASRENDMYFGAGISHFGLSFDYAYVPFSSFDTIQMMTIRFSL